jgi:stress response protein SCP2
MLQTQVLTKGQNTPLDPSISNLRMSVRWTAHADAINVDLVALIVGQDRRVRSDADMIFYNQPSTADGSVVHAGKVLGAGQGTDEVTIDISLLSDDVMGLTVAASTDGAPFGEITELVWCVFLESGEIAATYRVQGLTSERALVLGELYRRAGAWRLRAVGQGWEGGLAGLATDYGVSVAADESEPFDRQQDFVVTDSVEVELVGSDSPIAEERVREGSASISSSVTADPSMPAVGPAAYSNSAAVAEIEDPPASSRQGSALAKATSKVKIAAVKAAAVPVMRLADDTAWQPSRLFSISGIGGVDEQEKRATSALLWTMSAVKPLGRALTARATAPAGALETFLEVGFPLGEHRVIPDGVIRIARAGRIWTALVEVKTGDAVLQKEQLENYLRLAKRRKFDVVLTVSNEISTDPGLHPVQIAGGLLNNVSLVHLSWSEVMHEIRMLLAHHPFIDPLPMWILAELLKYLEHPRSGTMAFHDMGVTWVPVREAVAAGTLSSTDRKTEPVILAWHRLVRQLGLGLTARLGVPVKQTLPRRLLSDPDLRNHEAAQCLAGTGILAATFKVPDAAGPITVSVDLRTTQIRSTIELQAPQEGTLPRRVSWLTKQLKEAPDKILVEARFDPRPETTCERLGDLRERPGMLIPGPQWEPTSFVVSQVQPMGTKRSGAKGSFVSTVTAALDTFYADVVENVRPWTPPAPQLPTPASVLPALGPAIAQLENTEVPL